MNTQVNEADPRKPALSEKARRLLAAHDRAVSMAGQRRPALG